MNCPKCQLIEMRVDRVEGGIIYYKCKACGEEATQKEEELEESE